MSDLVGNPEDRFSRVAAQLTSSPSLHRPLLDDLVQMKLIQFVHIFMCVKMVLNLY